MIVQVTKATKELIWGKAIDVVALLGSTVVVQKVT